MSIFDHIDQNILGTMLGQLVEALLDARDRQRLHQRNTPFSTAELRLTEEDCNWLFNWTHISGAWIHQLLNSTGKLVVLRDLSMSVDEALGFVLTVVFSEYARRNYQADDEQGFWACVRHLFSRNTAISLFPTGYPTAELKGALKQGMLQKQIGLRHRFHETHVHQWYSSIFAQFGITHSYILNQLDSALLGLNVGRGAQYLLEVSKGPSSFNELWETCHQIKRGELDPTSARSILVRNPFVLPEWVDTILRVCEKHERRKTIYTPTESRWQEFAATPTLRWDGRNRPQFYIPLQVDQLDMDGEDDAEVIIGGVKVQSLIREPNSSCFESCAPISITATQIKRALLLTIHCEQSQIEQEVELWSESDLVTVYDLTTGQRLIKVRTLIPRHSYAVIAPSDMLVKEQPLLHMCGDWKFTYIVPNEVPQIEVTDDSGTVFETYAVTDQPQRAVFDADVQVEPTTSDDDSSSFSLVIKTRPPTELESVRVGTKRYMLQPDGDCWRTDVIQVGSEWFAPTVSLFIKPVNQPYAYVTRIAPIDKGFLVYDHQSWLPLKHGSELFITDAPLIVRAVGLYDQGNDDDTLCWVDGYHKIGGVYRRIQSLPVLDGYGESLRVCQNDLEVELRVVSSAVIWRGIIQSVTIDSSNHTVRLLLESEMSLSGYSLVLWHLDHGFVVIPIDANIVVDPDEVTANPELFLPAHTPLPQIIALAFENECRGVWWSDTLPINLPDENPVSDNDVLTMIRWLRLPVLRQPFDAWATDCLCRQIHAIQSWLLPALRSLSILPGHKFTISSSSSALAAWKRTLRQLLHSNENQLIDALRRKCSDWSSIDELRKLADISPRLALALYGCISNRIAGLNKNYSPDSFAKAIQADWLPFSEHTALYAIDNYLRADNYPCDHLVMQLLNADRTREWVLINCIRLDDMSESLLRASKQNVYSY